MISQVSVHGHLAPLYFWASYDEAEHHGGEHVVEHGHSPCGGQEAEKEEEARDEIDPSRTYPQ